MTKTVLAKRSAPEQSYSPALITAGLIVTDRARIPLFILCAALPGIFEATRPWVSNTDGFLFATIREFFACAVIAAIGATWVKRLRREGIPVSTRALVWSIGAGLGIWSLFSTPPRVGLLEPNDPARFFGVIISVVAVITGWRYFFLSAPFLFGIRGISSALTFARNLTRADPLLPARVIVPAASIKFLLLGILYAFSPDGRLLPVVYASPLIAAMAPIIGCYTALGLIIYRLPERTWNELGLDPYRQARTTTIVVRGYALMARVFTIRTSLIGFGLAILVWLGNAVRLAGLPLPAEITVRSVAIAAPKVIVTLTVRDEQGNFRGFRPVAFFLASERAFPITRQPEAVKLEGDPRDLRLRLPHDMTEAVLTVEFSTDRSSEDLRRLEDAYLWYGTNRLTKLDLKGALTLPPASEQSTAPPQGEASRP